MNHDDGPPPGSWIEIDADALEENLRNIRQEMAGTQVVMVVKADAYGHGVEAIVPIAEQAGIEEFAVFSAHEAVHVLDAHTDSRVQVMGHIGRSWDWVARNGVEPWLGDIAEWGPCLAAARRHVDNGGDPMQIHVEVETGMYRTGVIPDNALRILQDADAEDAVHVRGLCTHLAGAEDSRNRDRIQEQLQVFEAVEELIKDLGLHMPIRHIASSSAAIVEPAWRKDMVRIGVASYGLWPTPEVRHAYKAKQGNGLHLRRVMTWRSTVMAVQDVPRGAFIGYGKSHPVTRDTRVAIVPVGYGDGLARRMSNAGHVLIRGERCPIVGQVNMNMVQVDVAHLDRVRPGEDVVLIGAQGQEEVGVHSFAESQEIVDYELMARLSQDLPRVVMRPPLAPGH